MSARGYYGHPSALIGAALATQPFEQLINQAVAIARRTPGNFAGVHLSKEERDPFTPAEQYATQIFDDYSTLQAWFDWQDARHLKQDEGISSGYHFFMIFDKTRPVPEGAHPIPFFSSAKTIDLGSPKGQHTTRGALLLGIGVVALSLGVRGLRKAHHAR